MQFFFWLREGWGGGGAGEAGFEVVGLLWFVVTSQYNILGSINLNIIQSGHQALAFLPVKS